MKIEKQNQVKKHEEIYNLDLRTVNEEHHLFEGLAEVTRLTLTPFGLFVTNFNPTFLPKEHQNDFRG